jgi:gas vesicle protein
MQFSRRTAVYNIVKSILKTAVYIMDQTEGAAAEVRHRADRISDHVSDVVDKGKNAIYGEDHTLRNILVFATGLGVGVGAGILFAPSSGEETRNMMRDKVENIGDRMRGTFSSAKSRATGTEGAY